jgi:hypothetical protein
VWAHSNPQVSLRGKPTTRGGAKPLISRRSALRLLESWKHAAGSLASNPETLD